MKIQWKPHNVINVLMLLALNVITFKDSFVKDYLLKITRYCYHSVIVSNLSMTKSDHIKQIILFLILLKVIETQPDFQSD